MPLSDALSFSMPQSPANGVSPYALGNLPRQLQTTSPDTLECELEAMSERLSRTFEELSLIHDLSCNLDIASDRTSHCQQALHKVAGCVSASTIAIVFREKPNCGSLSSLSNNPKSTSGVGAAPPVVIDSTERPEAEIIQCGRHLDPEVILRIEEELGIGTSKVHNFSLRCAPEINRVASVPMQEAGSHSSRLLAIGQTPLEEFGTVEVQLMESVAMILRGHLEIHRQFEQMRQMFEGTVRALVSAIDAKDPYTCGHSSRVSEMAECLAADIGMSPHEIETVRMAGLLHDIGKIGVSDAVLRKPGRLNDAEFDEIKKHPELGYRILCGVRQFADILPGVRFHHEAWDGRGYPQGLAGEKIPLIARVLAVADAFDAMTSTRPYRNGMPIEQVEGIFREGAGKQWDAKVVELLLSNRPRMIRMMHHQFPE